MRGIALLSLLLWLGCSGSGDSSAKQKALLAANIFKEAPSGLLGEAATFSTKVRYLGDEVKSAVLIPGGEGTVTHYWEVLAPFEGDWKVFTHLVGETGDWFNLDGSEMRTAHPPSSWKAGEVIRDTQSFSLPKGWSSDFAEIALGFYIGEGAGNKRMPLSEGSTDSEGRAAVFRFKVDQRSAKKTKTPYLIRKVSSEITIDGVADEAAWSKAPVSPVFVSADRGREIGQKTSARLLWDEEFLYAFIEVEDSDVFSPYENQDDPLWKEDVVEFFIDADRNRRGYVELQVNPLGTHFDAWFPKTRAQPHHFEWQSAMQSKVVVFGTANNRSDKDTGWNAEIAIPLGDVKGMNKEMQVAIPPELGDIWKLNVVRIDNPKNKGLAAASWNPIPIEDFHALHRMLSVQFSDSEGGIAQEPALPSPTMPDSGEEVPEGQALPNQDQSEGNQRRVRPPGTGRNQLRDIRIKATKSGLVPKVKSQNERIVLPRQ